MILINRMLLSLLFVACHHASHSDASLGRVDGYGQIVKTLSWLDARNVRDITHRDIQIILRSEAAHVQRRPVQIFGEWTDDLAWTDATGRYEIVFGRMRHTHAPFSMFRFSGQFSTKDAGIDAVAAWLALLDPANVATRIEQLRASPDSFVEYEINMSGESVRISLGLSSVEGQWWSGGLDVENISRPIQHQAPP